MILRNYLQYDFSSKMLKLLSKPQLLEQAGKTTVEQCLIIIVLSLAMVSAVSQPVACVIWKYSSFPLTLQLCNKPKMAIYGR